MPQFVLDPGTLKAARAFNQLDAFTQGYVEALFFTHTGTADDEELQDAAFVDLAPETLARIVDDCRAFRDTLPKDHHGRTALDLACDYAPAPYDETQAGRDFWYTRCGHGCGFWDRGLGPVGDELSEHACHFGNLDVYRGDDGLVYVM